MKLEELEMQSGLRRALSGPVIGIKFAAGTTNEKYKNLPRLEIINMVRTIRSQCLLWCDDIIGFVNEEREEKEGE